MTIFLLSHVQESFTILSELNKTSYSVTVARSRGLFDTYIKVHPSTKPLLSINTDIIADLYFETAVAKIQPKKESSSLSVENYAVEHLFENGVQSGNAEKLFKCCFRKIFSSACKLSRRQ